MNPGTPADSGQDGGEDSAEPRIRNQAQQAGRESQQAQRGLDAGVILPNQDQLVAPITVPVAVTPTNQANAAAGPSSSSSNQDSFVSSGRRGLDTLAFGQLIETPNERAAREDGSGTSNAGPTAPGRATLTTSALSPATVLGSTPAINQNATFKPAAPNAPIPPRTALEVKATAQVPHVTSLPNAHTIGPCSELPLAFISQSGGRLGVPFDRAGRVGRPISDIPGGSLDVGVPGGSLDVGVPGVLPGGSPSNLSNLTTNLTNNLNNLNYNHNVNNSSGNSGNTPYSAGNYSAGDTPIGGSSASSKEVVGIGTQSFGGFGPGPAVAGVPSSNSSMPTGHLAGKPPIPKTDPSTRAPMGGPGLGGPPMGGAPLGPCMQTATSIMAAKHASSTTRPAYRLEKPLRSRTPSGAAGGQFHKNAFRSAGGVGTSGSQNTTMNQKLMQPDPFSGGVMPSVSPQRDVLDVYNKQKRRSQTQVSGAGGISGAATIGGLTTDREIISAQIDLQSDVQAIMAGTSGITGRDSIASSTGSGAGAISHSGPATGYIGGPGIGRMSGTGRSTPIDDQEGLTFQSFPGGGSSADSTSIPALPITKSDSVGSSLAGGIPGKSDSVPSAIPVRASGNSVNSIASVGSLGSLPERPMTIGGISGINPPNMNYSSFSEAEAKTKGSKGAIPGASATTSGGFIAGGLNLFNFPVNVSNSSTATLPLPGSKKRKISESAFLPLGATSTQKGSKEGPAAAINPVTQLTAKKGLPPPTEKSSASQIPSDWYTPGTLAEMAGSKPFLESEISKVKEKLAQKRKKSIVAGTVSAANVVPGCGAEAVAGIQAVPPGAAVLPPKAGAAGITSSAKAKQPLSIMIPGEEQKLPPPKSSPKSELQSAASPFAQFGRLGKEVASGKQLQRPRIPSSITEEGPESEESELIAGKAASSVFGKSSKQGSKELAELSAGGGAIMKAKASAMFDAVGPTKVPFGTSFDSARRVDEKLSTSRSLQKTSGPSVVQMITPTGGTTVGRIAAGFGGPAESLRPAVPAEKPTGAVTLPTFVTPKPDEKKKPTAKKTVRPKFQPPKRMAKKYAHAPESPSALDQEMMGEGVGDAVERDILMRKLVELKEQRTDVERAIESTKAAVEMSPGASSTTPASVQKGRERGDRLREAREAREGRDQREQTPAPSSPAISDMIKVAIKIPTTPPPERVDQKGLLQNFEHLRDSGSESDQNSPDQNIQTWPRFLKPPDLYTPQVTAESVSEMKEQLLNLHESLLLHDQQKEMMAQQRELIQQQNLSQLNLQADGIGGGGAGDNLNNLIPPHPQSPSSSGPLSSDFMSAGFQPPERQQVQTAIFLLKHLPFEVLYDEGNKSYRMVPTFYNLASFVQDPDLTTTRIIRVGRPMVRNVVNVDVGPGPGGFGGSGAGGDRGNQGGGAGSSVFGAGAAGGLTNPGSLGNQLGMQMGNPNQMGGMNPGGGLGGGGGGGYGMGAGYSTGGYYGNQSSYGYGNRNSSTSGYNSNRPPGPYDPLRRADRDNMNNSNAGQNGNGEEGKVLSSEYRTTFTEEEQTTLTQFLAFHGAVPVFPSEETLNSAGAAEQVLFSLFHYIVEMEELGSLEPSDWVAYRNSQQDYANVCLKVMEDESADYIWVNDYQLMLVPQLLKKSKPQAPVGFYLHSVFPSSEIYRIFPFREELLTGVLAANVIGFHSFQYIRHFQTACTRILGVECSRNTVSASHYASFQYGNSDTKLCAIQKGLDLEAYEQCLKEDDTQAKIEELRLTFGHRKVILGVDLLEERKGIPHKFLAFNKFLQSYPEWAHNCVFLQICTQQPHSIDVQAGSHHASTNAPGAGYSGGSGGYPTSTYAPNPGQAYAGPSGSGGSGGGGSSGGSGSSSSLGDTNRTSIRETLLSQIYEMGGEISSTYGSFSHLPVHFLDQSYSPEELVPIYAMADVCICTPLRDNMSTTAVEFIFCQRYQDTPGVLVLSEFTGSVQSLRACALTVNPWDTNQFADSIFDALTMSKDERQERYLYGYNHVATHTNLRWMRDIISELQDVKVELDEGEDQDDILKVPPKLIAEGRSDPVDSFKASRKRRLLVLGFTGTLMSRNRYFHPNILSTCKIPERVLETLRTLSEDPNSDVVVVSSVSQEVLETALNSVPELWLVAEGGTSYRRPNSKEWIGRLTEDVDLSWMNAVEQVFEYFQVVVGRNSVEVRPVEVSKANMLEIIIEEIKDGGRRQLREEFLREEEIRIREGMREEESLINLRERLAGEVGHVGGVKLLSSGGITPSGNNYYVTLADGTIATGDNQYKRVDGPYRRVIKTPTSTGIAGGNLTGGQSSKDEGGESSKDEGGGHGGHGGPRDCNVSGPSSGTEEGGKSSGLVSAESSYGRTGVSGIGGVHVTGNRVKSYSGDRTHGGGRNQSQLQQQAHQKNSAASKSNSLSPKLTTVSPSGKDRDDDANQNFDFKRKDETVTSRRTVDPPIDRKKLLLWGADRDGSSVRDVVNRGLEGRDRDTTPKSTMRDADRLDLVTNRSQSRSKGSEIDTKHNSPAEDSGTAGTSSHSPDKRMQRPLRYTPLKRAGSSQSGQSQSHQVPGGPAHESPVDSGSSSGQNLVQSGASGTTAGTIPGTTSGIAGSSGAGSATSFASSSGVGSGPAGSGSGVGSAAASGTTSNINAPLSAASQLAQGHTVQQFTSSQTSPGPTPSNSNYTTLTMQQTPASSSQQTPIASSVGALTTSSHLSHSALRNHDTNFPPVQRSFWRPRCDSLPGSMAELRNLIPAAGTEVFSSFAGVGSSCDTQKGQNQTKEDEQTKQQESSSENSSSEEENDLNLMGDDESSELGGTGPEDAEDGPDGVGGSSSDIAGGLVVRKKKDIAGSDGGNGDGSLEVIQRSSSKKKKRRRRIKTRTTDSNFSKEGGPTNSKDGAGNNTNANTTGDEAGVPGSGASSHSSSHSSSRQQTPASNQHQHQHKSGPTTHKKTSQGEVSHKSHPIISEGIYSSAQLSYTWATKEYTVDQGSISDSEVPSAICTGMGMYGHSNTVTLGSVAGNFDASTGSGENQIMKLLHPGAAFSTNASADNANSGTSGSHSGSGSSGNAAGQTSGGVNVFWSGPLIATNTAKELVFGSSDHHGSDRDGRHHGGHGDKHSSSDRDRENTHLLRPDHFNNPLSSNNPLNPTNSEMLTTHGEIYQKISYSRVGTAGAILGASRGGSSAIQEHHPVFEKDKEIREKIEEERFPGMGSGVAGSQLQGPGSGLGGADTITNTNFGVPREFSGLLRGTAGMNVGMGSMGGMSGMGVSGIGGNFGAMAVGGMASQGLQARQMFDNLNRNRGNLGTNVTNTNSNLAFGNVNTYRGSGPGGRGNFPLFGPQWTGVGGVRRSNVRKSRENQNSAGGGSNSSGAGSGSGSGYCGPSSGQGGSSRESRLAQQRAGGGGGGLGGGGERGEREKAIAVREVSAFGATYATTGSGAGNVNESSATGSSNSLPLNMGNSLRRDDNSGRAPSNSSMASSSNNAGLLANVNVFGSAGSTSGTSIPTSNPTSPIISSTTPISAISGHVGGISRARSPQSFASSGAGLPTKESKMTAATVQRSTAPIPGMRRDSSWHQNVQHPIVQHPGQKLNAPIGAGISEDIASAHHTPFTSKGGDLFVSSGHGDSSQNSAQTGQQYLQSQQPAHLTATDLFPGTNHNPLGSLSSHKIEEKRDSSCPANMGRREHEKQRLRRQTDGSDPNSAGPSLFVEGTHDHHAAFSPTESLSNSGSNSNSAELSYSASNSNSERRGNASSAKRNYVSPGTTNIRSPNRTANHAPNDNAPSSASLEYPAPVQFTAVNLDAHNANNACESQSLSFLTSSGPTSPSTAPEAESPGLREADLRELEHLSMDPKTLNGSVGTNCGEKSGGASTVGNTNATNNANSAINADIKSNLNEPSGTADFPTGGSAPPHFPQSIPPASQSPTSDLGTQEAKFNLNNNFQTNFQNSFNNMNPLLNPLNLAESLPPELESALSFGESSCRLHDWVLVLGDFVMRDEDIFQSVRKLVEGETDNLEGASSPGGGHSSPGGGGREERTNVRGESGNCGSSNVRGDNLTMPNVGNNGMHNADRSAMNSNENVSNVAKNVVDPSPIITDRGFPLTSTTPITSSLQSPNSTTREVNEGIAAGVSPGPDSPASVGGRDNHIRVVEGGSASSSAIAGEGNSSNAKDANSTSANSSTNVSGGDGILRLETLATNYANKLNALGRSGNEIPGNVAAAAAAVELEGDNYHSGTTGPVSHLSAASLPHSGVSAPQSAAQGDFDTHSNPHSAAREGVRAEAPFEHNLGLLAGGYEGAGGKLPSYVGGNIGTAFHQGGGLGGGIGGGIGGITGLGAIGGAGFQGQDDLTYISCTVGKKNSRAMYYVNDTDDVAFLLAKFAWTLGKRGEDEA